MKNIRLTSSLFIFIILLFPVVACKFPGFRKLSVRSTNTPQTQTSVALQTMLTSTSIITTPTITSSSPIVTQISSTTPTPTPTLTLTPIPNCVDKAKFISETVPDDTVLAPNTPFTKTWTFQNFGTCTWTSDYILAFSRGDAMSGTSPVQTGLTIPPNGSITLTTNLIAPATPGVYQGHWELRNNRGQDFAHFWVKIRVATTGETPLNFGNPSFSDNFNKKPKYFNLSEDAHISFEFDDPGLVMLAFDPIGDQWRLAELGKFDNLALEVRFKIRDTCAGKDNYGVIVRAQDSVSGIINSTYVFGFSCDGSYRVYRMDGGNYTAIRNWTNNPNIIPGAGKENSMLVVARGNAFQLYANQVLIFEFVDDVYSRGYIGLMIGSQKTDYFEVLVKQLTYWLLPK